MKVILLEELSQDSYKLIDKMVGSISHKYAGNYGINQEDLYQELQLKYYEKFGDFTDEDLRKNKALVDKSLERAAIDYYRYTRRRYDSESEFTDGVDLVPADDGRGAGSIGKVDPSLVRGSQTSDRSGNIGRNRFKKTDEGLVVRDMLNSLQRKFGKYSDEVRYFIGMISLEGLLDYVKDMLVRGDYELARSIKDKNGIGEFIDPENPLPTGNSRYRNTARKVADYLKRERY